ncbi:hypothetical protein FOTG_05329 [Fusarium oxysporum f. sp. vasinfectum 25433]|uniref:Uncharacterized protein n=1 Tax=Fusarium oxysporum f. sp. vasinfectum 25433 TaxID=1089449 RepID=X0LT73_FUSOX|nr:hypothetical protein FOTG_05329 [Fusarium oxysporum f. sp. vasinfectum 25433]
MYRVMFQYFLVPSHLALHIGASSQLIPGTNVSSTPQSYGIGSVQQYRTRGNPYPSCKTHTAREKGSKGFVSAFISATDCYPLTSHTLNHPMDHGPRDTTRLSR